MTKKCQIRQVLGVITAAVIGSTTYTAAAQDFVTFAGWGGVTQEAERKAYFEPAEKALGITVREDRHGGYGGLKAHVQAGNVSWDVVGTGFAICEKAAQNGLAESLDYSQIDTSGLPDEFIRPDFVGLWTFSYGIAYRTDKYGDNPPQSWADFWDVEKFPGRRSLWAGGRYVLEAALMADGVKPDEVYDVLMSEGGVDRAFASLEKIKPHVDVWWTSQGQAMQLIRDHEVDMLLLANGRAGALAEDGAPVGFQWNQALLDIEGFMIPKGAPHVELAHKVISYSLQPKQQAAFTQHIQYGPTHPGAYDFISDERAALLPTSPQNIDKQGIVSPEWYASKAGEDSLARLARFLQQ